VTGVPLYVNVKEFEERERESVCVQVAKKEALLALYLSIGYIHFLLLPIAIACVSVYVCQ
jgi:hypothetical protein